jgi:hypothetical protein
MILPFIIISASAAGYSSLMVTVCKNYMDEKRRFKKAKINSAIRLAQLTAAIIQSDEDLKCGEIIAATSEEFDLRVVSKKHKRCVSKKRKVR